MHRSRSIVVAFAALFLLPACQVQSGIQGRYVAKQSECRSEAEDRMDTLPSNVSMSAKQRNAALVDKFSTCMIKAGWHVARPVKNPTNPPPAGSNPREAALPAQPLPGQPSDVITAGARQSSPANQPVKTESNVLQPGPGQPALNQPANSQLPTGGAGAGPRPATYQRVYTPQPAAAPLPGRQF